MPQSSGQVTQLSDDRHTWSPQVEQAPQSTRHVRQSSPAVASQNRSPHMRGQLPQSPGHVLQSSAPAHVPSPQSPGQAPQSAAHDVHVSSVLHVPSPQPGQAPQS